MDPGSLRVAFRMAVLILGTALATLPFQRPGSAEFVVTVMAAAVGGLFVGAVVVLSRLAAPPPPPKSRDKRKEKG